MRHHTGSNPADIEFLFAHEKRIKTLINKPNYLILNTLNFAIKVRTEKKHPYYLKASVSPTIHNLGCSITRLIKF